MGLAYNVLIAEDRKARFYKGLLARALQYVVPSDTIEQSLELELHTTFTLGCGQLIRTNYGHPRSLLL